ncbi:hypothetical protein RCL1_001400 [Eukaryota sp. TZLM3-RCL]
MFVLDPPCLSFTTGHYCTKSISILNSSKDQCRFILLPFANNWFRFELLYLNQHTGWVAPGCSLNLNIIPYKIPEDARSFDLSVTLRTFFKETPDVFHHINIPITVAPVSSTLCLPKLLDFGKVPLGSSKFKQIVLKKDSRAVHEESISININPPDIGFSVKEVTRLLPCNFEVSFSPKVLGTVRASLSVNTDSQMVFTELVGSCLAGDTYKSLVEAGTLLLNEQSDNSSKLSTKSFTWSFQRSLKSSKIKTNQSNLIEQDVEELPSQTILFPSYMVPPIIDPDENGNLPLLSSIYEPQKIESKFVSSLKHQEINVNRLKLAVGKVIVLNRLKRRFLKMKNSCNY